jgi:ATP-dependent protease HslVU (ClpYQ) peptidase subunit
MTVIAWDGKALAADKRSTIAGMAATTTKIHRVFGELVGFSGSGSHAAELLEWVKGGRKPEAFPRRADADEAAGTLIIDKQRRILQFAWNSPNPEIIEDAFFARGAGRDYAMAAMHLGCDARKAVEVACVFDTSCGNGIDVLEFD